MYEISILFIPLFYSMQSIPALAYRLIMKGLKRKGCSSDWETIVLMYHCAIIETK